MAVSTVDQLDTLRHLYAWEDPDEVRRLLLEHPETHAVLVEAVEHVRRNFGDGTRIGLRIAHELDGSGPPKLFADIHTAQDVADAHASIDRFDAEWWLDAMPAVQGVLSFGLLVI